MIKKHAPQTATHDVGHALQALQLNEQDLQSVKTLPPGSGVFSVKEEVFGKVSVPESYLNSYFTTGKTIKRHKKQLELFEQVFFDGKAIDKPNALKQFDIILAGENSSNRLLDLDLWQSRVMKGLFKLAQEQGINEAEPVVYIKNIYELFNRVLERVEKGKRGYKDFSGTQTKELLNALVDLCKTSQKLIIKQRYTDGKDKKGKDIFKYKLYMTYEPILKMICYREGISESEMQTITESDMIKGGKFSIKILPLLIKDWHRYFKLLPVDVGSEINQYCPDLKGKKIPQAVYEFIDWLHRHNNIEVRRERLTIINELGLEREYRKNKKRTTDKLLSCYEIAMQTKYLTKYQINQPGKLGFVDVFTLNPDKYYHFEGNKALGVDDEMTDLDVEEVKA